MKAIRYTIPAVAVALLVVGLAGRYGQMAGIHVPLPIVGPQKIMAVVVEETAERPKLPRSQLMALTSAKAAKWAKQGGHRLLVVDKDIFSKSNKPPEALAPVLDRAKNKPKPCVVILSESGKLLYEGFLPTNEADWLELLEKYGGK